MLTVRRPRRETGSDVGPSPARPVMLATLEVPFDAAAAAFAVDTAVETGQPLVVVNAVEILLAPASLTLGYGDVDPTEDDAAGLRAPAELARSLGVRVERLRLKSPHPVAALVQLAAERRPGLLVFGPDRSRLRRRRYRNAAREVRDRAPCLVWLAA